MQMTPVRSLGEHNDAGYWVLSHSEIAYADGGEARLLSIVSGASDLSSTSIELRDAAEDWPTEYSTSPARANLLRGFALDSTMAVLEIGAGCGPISRYLGETCGMVDTVEPMPERAAVAAQRTRDQDNVRVHVGLLEDIPADEAYDLIVVVGVLEYVGAGSPRREPYLDFLRQCYERLKPGGSLLLAIENRLGVKYLSGAAEDHSGRPFDGVEGYLRTSPARTFTRSALEALLTEVGLTATTFGAFPDYKLPRFLLSRDLVARAPQVAVDAPLFPSRDYSAAGVDAADERALWAALVETGAAFEFCNSWVTVAAKGPARPLWPRDQLAVQLSGGRDPALSPRTEFVATDESTYVDRTLARGATDARSQEVRWRGGREPLFEGDLLFDQIVDDEARLDAFRTWLEMLPAADAGPGGCPVDLTPWNIVLTPSGPQAIDQEWFVDGYARVSLLLRGLVYSAEKVARRRRYDEAAKDSILDLALSWAADLGIEVSPEDVDQFIADESDLQAAVQAKDAQEIRGALETLLGKRLSAMRPADRHGADILVRASTVAELHAAVDAIALERDLTRQHADNLQAIREQLEGAIDATKAHADDVQRNFDATKAHADDVQRNFDALQARVRRSWKGRLRSVLRRVVRRGR